LINTKQFERVVTLVEDAVGKGAKESILLINFSRSFKYDSRSTNHFGFSATFNQIFLSEIEKNGGR
jgi:hypothetical protein